MNYFAYGSNMDKDRMSERNINFTSRQFAILTGYKLVFNKKAKDGNFTYANIVPFENDFVEGAVYEFPDNEITNLDIREGYPKHYNKVQVSISDKLGNEIQAVTYIAQKIKLLKGSFLKKNISIIYLLDKTFCQKNILNG